AISGPRAAVSTGGRSLPVQVLPCVRGPHGAVHVATQAGGRGSLVHPDSGHDMGISATRPPHASGAADVDVSVVVADPAPEWQVSGQGTGVRSIQPAARPAASGR